MATLSVPQGEFDLVRHPLRKNDTLRAWDAADEYLLAHLAGVPTPVSATADAEASDGADAAAVDLSGTVVVVNDGSGALAVALAAHRPVSWGDSYLSHLATAQNQARNGVPPDDVALLASLDELPERIDVVVLKLPKHHGLLEDQLARLAPRLHPGTVVVAGAMAKHVHTSTLQLLERYVGPTRTSLARKKARLVLPTTDASLEPPAPAEPRGYALQPGNLRIRQYPGVFSAERLDMGTSFFLDNLPDQAGQIRIVDLGCGNGVVGTVLSLDNADAEVVFVDESYLAVASAEVTARANLGTDRELEFLVGDGLSQLRDRATIERGTVDLVFNNPPFHDDHALSDATAWQMFTESHAALRPGGQLWVVGNRHLAYHAKLKRIFGNCDIIASNSKFVVFRATRT
jgi:23S rRNA (guanine1835-N2)-methyltransferase